MDQICPPFCFKISETRSSTCIRSHRPWRPAGYRNPLSLGGIICLPRVWAVKTLQTVYRSKGKHDAAGIGTTGGRAGKVGGVRKNRVPVSPGGHLQDEVIVLCLRMNLRHSLSYRDLER